MNRIKQRLNSLLKIIITIICVLILILPFYEVYTSETEEILFWKKIYIVNDWGLLMVYFPFILLWFINMIVKKQKVNLVINVLLLALSILYFLYNLNFFISTIQDLTPSYGLFLSLFLFPLLSIKVVLSNVKKK